MALRLKEAGRHEFPKGHMPMTDNKAKVGTSDRSRINLHERYEIDYWTRRWQTSEQQLRDAVKKVGPMVLDVAKCLGKPI